MLVQSGGQKIEEIRRNIFTPLNLSHQIDDEIQRRINVLIHKDVLTKEEAIRISELLLSVNQDQDPGVEINRRILSILEQRQVITKKDLLSLRQKIEELTLRFAEFDIPNS
jgi:polyhydroxyalkanoate synthesis regulator phasin